MTQPDRIELNGTVYEFDFKGSLKNSNSWSPQLMEWYAEREKIKLSDDHRKIIDYLRVYFAQYQAHPVARTVVAEMGEQLGKNKGTVKYLHTLFPIGIHQAYKIAGLPSLKLSV